MIAKNSSAIENLYFGEVSIVRLFPLRKIDRLSTRLTVASTIIFIIAGFFLVIGCFWDDPMYIAWFMILLLPGIALLLLGYCLRTISDEISDQLKLLDDELRKKINSQKTDNE